MSQRLPVSKAKFSYCGSKLREIANAHSILVRAEQFQQQKGKYKRTLDHLCTSYLNTRSQLNAFFDSLQASKVIQTYNGKGIIAFLRSRLSNNQ